MSEEIIASEGEKKEFYLVPAETYPAVCYDIWDIGLQDTGFKRENGDSVIQHKVIIAWELNETIPTGKYAGKRATISKTYTLSLSEKANLRKDLENWRGKAFTEAELKGFNLVKLIGANAMISVIHKESKGNTYANVGGVSKMMKGLEPMIPENKRSTPDWVNARKLKAVHPESDAGLSAGGAGGEDDGEGIPF